MSAAVILSAEGVQFAVESALLVDASPVFATLQHLPSDPDERAITLSGDTAHDVRWFLEALRSADLLARAALPQLLSIASVAHKYECDALAASAFRLVCDAVRTSSPAPDSLVLHRALALASRFGAQELDTLSDALIARTVDPLPILHALDASCVHAPRLEAWALYALVTTPNWRALPLALELRCRLLLGENALRDVQPPRWAALPRDHAPCARAWANAWPDGAVRGKVDVVCALKYAAKITAKRLSLTARRDHRPCEACAALAKLEVDAYVRHLEVNMLALFTEEGAFDFDWDGLCDATDGNRALSNC